MYFILGAIIVILITVLKKKFDAYFEQFNIGIKDEDEINKFLAEECKGGEYVAITLMFNKQHYTTFLKHFNEFQSRLITHRHDKKDTRLLGKNKQKPLKVVDNVTNINKEE